MNPVKILYVEDNDDLRATISLLLEHPEREVATCADAEQALVAFERGPADIVVTDVSLPGMSGVDLARQLVEKAPDVWVVLCSGYEVGRHVEQIGPRVRALAKPFEVEDLETLITDLSASVVAARNEG